MLVKESGDPGLPARVEAGEDSGFDAATRAILAFAEKLTLHPRGMEEEDLTPLRGAGLEEEDILDVAMVTAYYAYMNRVVQALGVSLHPAQKGVPA